MLAEITFLNVVLMILFGPLAIATAILGVLVIGTAVYTSWLVAIYIVLGIISLFTGKDFTS